MANKEVNFIGSTKKQIWDAYSETLNELKKHEGPVSTTEIAEQKKNEKSIITATSKDFITIAFALKDMADNITEANQEFGDLLRAIDLKKEELREIHKVEEVANSAAAFAIAQEQQLQKQKDRLEELEDEFLDALEERKKTEEQRVEEWEYNFRIKKRDAEDKFNAMLREREQQVEAREKAIGDTEEAIKNLKSEISMLKYSFDGRLEDQVDKIKNQLVKDADNEARLFRTQIESHVALKDEENKSLKYKIGDLSKVIDQQKNMIHEMQTQINSMAIAALKAQGDAATINRVAEVVASGGNKK